MNTNTFLFDPKKQNFEWCSASRGHILSLPTLLLLIQNLLGNLFPERDPSDIHDNIAQSLGLSVQPLTSVLVRLPDDIVVILGPAEPEHLLLHGESREGEL